MSDPLDVSGAWNGIFNYPRELPPSGFRVELREHAGAVTGETQERSDRGPDRGQTITALIDGTRAGYAVVFTKRYDTLRRAHYAVQYQGTLNAEGDEISGRWTILGQWSGSFLMTRQSRRAADVEQRVAETVDR